MPRPPILPILDWKQIFENGREFEPWIEEAKVTEHRDKMLSAVARQDLEATTAATLRGLSRAVHVVAFAEDWCGDVVRHVPVLHRLQQEAPNLHVRYLAREEQPEAFARFLTNGGEAVPKFVFLNDRFVECGNWGPMGDEGRELIARGKACGDVAAARVKVSALHTADKDRAVVVRELVGRVLIASAERP